MKTLYNLLRGKDQGFTLVELMVVVAIIGLLAAVAVPNFKKYQAKSRTSEAKLQLSALYTAETAALVDFDSYGTCLQVLGYDPDPEKINRYYAIGFDKVSALANGIIVAAGEKNCFTAVGAIYAFSAGKKIIPAMAYPASYGDIGPANLVSAEGDAFTAEALGYVSAAQTTSANGDRWTINNNKKMVHTQIGY